MGIHAISYYEESDPVIGLHELVEFEEFCSAYCMNETLDTIQADRGFRGGDLDTPAGDVEYADGNGGIGYGGFPCGQESDTCVYCGACETHLHCGIEEQSCQQS